MTPHMEALAYRIWAYANPREWDCSYAEIADGTGIGYDLVARVISDKGWAGRVPKGGNTKRDRSGTYVAWHKKGRNVDPNLLAVDQLML